LARGLRRHELEYRDDIRPWLNEVCGFFRRLYMTPRFLCSIIERCMRLPDLRGRVAPNRVEDVRDRLWMVLAPFMYQRDLGDVERVPEAQAHFEGSCLSTALQLLQYRAAARMQGRRSTADVALKEVRETADTFDANTLQLYRWPGGDDVVFLAVNHFWDARFHHMPVS
jgi:hypothetical protein